MSGPQSPGPAGDPPAAGSGPQVPVPPRDDAGGTGDLGQLNQTYPWGRVGLNDDGSLDEIVVENCGVQLEQMDTGSWFLGVDRPGLTVAVWLNSPQPSSPEIESDPPAIPVTARWELGEPVDGAPLTGKPVNGDSRGLAARLASLEVVAEELARRVGRREFERDEARRERDEARASLAAALAAIARVRALHGRTFQGVAKDVVRRAELLAALEPPGGGT